MTLPISLLKNILNIQHNCIHITSCELETVNVHRFCEDFEELRIIVSGRPFRRVQKLCPYCKKKCPGYDTKNNSESTWRAPNLNGIKVFICYQPQRIECPEHGVHTEYIPWSDGNSRFTPEFNNEIAWMVCRMTKSDIALFEGINWRTVGNCVKAAQERIEPDITVRMHNLRRICVDETSYKKGHEYITVVYDMERNRVVWVHKGHGLDVFRLFCNILTQTERKKIDIVAGDGASWIDTCVNEFFPNATRCIDFFHVVQWTNEKLDEVRTLTVSKATRELDQREKELRQKEADERISIEAKRIEIENRLKALQEELSALHENGSPSRRKPEILESIRELTDMLSEDTTPPRKKGRPRKGDLSQVHLEELHQMSSKAKEIKGAKYALAHNPENCTEAQAEKIRLIANSYPDLYKAYQLKESLRIILHMTDYEMAEKELMQWINEAADSGLKPFEELSKKIARHTNSILSSIKFQANSAKSEAVNTTIKVLIKMARGFRNTDNMISLIYLKCSDLVIPLFNRPQMSPENAAAARKAANELRKKREAAHIPDEV